MTSKSKLRALRRKDQPDELDTLLADALQHELNNRRGKGTVTALKGISQTLHETYANPDNWEATGIVMVIYLNEQTGEQETIGAFQEFVHRKTAARKLCRCQESGVLKIEEKPHDNSLPVLHITAKHVVRKEVYTNPTILYGKPEYCPPVPKGTALEQRAINDYLARTKPVSLDEFLGKVDAAVLLKQLKDWGVNIS